MALIMFTKTGLNNCNINQSSGININSYYESSLEEINGHDNKFSKSLFKTKNGISKRVDDWKRTEHIYLDI